jgi:hypothetical protein
MLEWLKLFIAEVNRVNAFFEQKLSEIIEDFVVMQERCVMKNNELNLVIEEVKYRDQVEVFELNNKLTRTYALDISDGPKLADILFKRINIEEESHPEILRHKNADHHLIAVQKFLY